MNTKTQKEIFKDLIDYILGHTNDIDIDEQIKKNFQYFYPRLILVFSKIPKLVNVINKYYNHLYLNLQNEEVIKQILNNFRFIIQHNNIKFNDLHNPYYNFIFNDRQYFYEFLDKVSNGEYTEKDKKFYYYLYYKFNINKEQYKKYLQSKKEKNRKLNKEELALIEKIINESNAKKFDNVEELYEYILRKYTNKIYCNSCPLYGSNDLLEIKKHVIFDSNVTNIEDIQIVFIGINPGAKEVEIGKPFVGNSGKKLREKISEIQNVGYLLTNVIFCPTNNQEIIKDKVKTLKTKCNYYKDILKYLPNKKLIVLFGDIPKQFFNIKGRITTLYNKFYEYDNNCKIIVLPHPSSLLRSNSKSVITAWNEGWNNIKNYISNYINLNNIQIQSKSITVYKSNTVIKDISSISEIPQNETLFDIRILKKENKYLITMLDENGKKKYYKLPFKFVFYYKENAKPQDCHYFEDISKLKMMIITNYEEYQKIKQNIANMLKAK